MTKNNSNNINSHKGSRLGFFIGISAVVVVVVVIIIIIKSKKPDKETKYKLIGSKKR